MPYFDAFIAADICTLKHAYRITYRSAEQCTFVDADVAADEPAHWATNGPAVEPAFGSAHESADDTAYRRAYDTAFGSAIGPAYDTAFGTAHGTAHSCTKCYAECYANVGAKCSAFDFEVSVSRVRVFPWRLRYRNKLSFNTFQYLSVVLIITLVFVNICFKTLRFTKRVF